jgi:Mycothiol maleylpyruvate isomerase N-terminal domain
MAFCGRSRAASATVGPVSSPSRPVTRLDKDEVLAGLFAVWDEVDTVLAPLSDQQWQAQTPLPGWNVHDVTAHLIGTESMLQGAAIPEAASARRICSRNSARRQPGAAKRSAPCQMTTGTRSL